MFTTCYRCKNSIDIPMYFYTHRITKETAFLSTTEQYVAKVTGKAICPHCGEEIHQDFTSIISKQDIVELAIREEKNKCTHE